MSHFKLLSKNRLRIAEIVGTTFFTWCAEFHGESPWGEPSHELGVTSAVSSSSCSLEVHAFTCSSSSSDHDARIFSHLFTSFHPTNP